MRKNNKNIVLVIVVLLVLSVALSSIEVINATNKIPPNNSKKFADIQYVSGKMVTYGPSADAGVSQKYPSTNFGSQSYIFAGHYKFPGDTTYYVRRAYIKFYLPSGVPAEDIVNAKLTLYLYKAKTYFESGTTHKIFYVYRVTLAWTESGITWNKKAGVAWSPYASFTVYSTHSDKRSYTVYITELVKKWLDGTYTNHGIVITSIHTEQHALVSWYSKEGSSTYRPKLTISYKYGPDIEITPDTVNGYQGSTISVTVKVYSRGGFSGTVSFTVTSIPSGFTYSFTPTTVYVTPTSSKTTTFKVNIPSGTSTGQKKIWVKAYAGSYYDYDLLKINVLSSGFSFSVSPTLVTVSQGGSITVTLKVTKIGAYNKPVTFSTQSAPAGITVTYNPSSVVPTGTATATIKAAANTPAGTYTVKIKAKGADGLTIIRMVTVKVVAAGFTLSSSKQSLTIFQGGSATFTLTVTKVGTYSKTVTFSLENAPSGVTASFSPSSLTPTGTTTVTVQVSSSVPPGTYSIKFKAMGTDGKTAHVTLQLIVKAKPFKYSLSLSQSSISINKGESASVVVNVNLVSGTAKQVQLSLEGLPAGTYSFSPQTVTPTATSTLTINTATLSEGTYTVTIKATHGSIVKTATLTVKVIGLDFSISVSPSSLEVEQGKSGTVVVTLTLVKGSAEKVTLSATGMPSGVVSQFSPQEVKLSGSSQLTIYVSSDSPAGTYAIVVKAVSKSGVEKTATFTLKIKEKSKCIIATATYGSEVADEVQILRNFRDNIVLSTHAGTSFYVAFNAFYYSWSPYVAYWIQDNPWIKPVFKTLIYPLIGILLFSTYLTSPLISINAELAVYVTGTIISALIGAVYYSPIIYLILRRKEKYLSERYLKRIGLITLSTLTACILAQAIGASSILVFTTSAYVLSVIALSSYAVPLILHRLRSKIC